ncbi:transposase (plasmid) [Lichenicola cladoniae]|uniref:Transposase n=1 Tax=Lichenicola cladoniae TaxID=1484109 RepID=A0A6M8HX93_9PROT|nr:transposase [Acetobacteraceae bacterium]QKE92988.1 transposase [Lichenicola cladoniae]
MDSTGLPMFGQGEWDAEKHGRTPRRWRKLHLAIDAQTGEIVAHVLTDLDVGDITAVPVLLETVEGPIASVIADGAYDGASVYRATSLRQRDRHLTSSSHPARLRWSTITRSLPRRSGIIMSNTLPRRAAWPGRRRPGMAAAASWRPRSVATSTASVRSCEQDQPMASRAKSPSPSTRSIG